LTRKRIAYVQYTNPAAYPPLIHSSRMLAERGWDVLFLGAGSDGSGALRLPKHERIRTAQLRFQRPGWRQKLHYAYFHLWCLARVIAFRPAWIYCSDLLACPCGWMFSMLGMRVVYHEHDSPAPKANGVFERFLLRARAFCGRRAICVIPNARRGESMRQASGAPRLPLLVWNCPRLAEVAPAKEPIGSGRLRLLYHGSIVPERLPLAIIDAISAVPGAVSLTVVGYETAGSKGYVEHLRTRAAELGISERVHVLGTLSTREELMSVCRDHDAGLALMPQTADDLNLRTMEGASNKPFDYLACGLALIISRLPEWEAMFAAPGYAYACDPGSAADLARALTKLIEDPARTRAMGEAGRQRVLAEWNYEHQFEPVMNLLEGEIAQPSMEGRRERAMEARG
jgi:glycosyltransferase involved in cell wall biosynthesis